VSDYIEVSIDAVMSRIAELNSAFAPPAPQPPATPAATPAGGSPFAGMLQGAMGSGGVAAPGAIGGGSAGQRILAAVQGEVGQAESPPGSNDSPRIAMYRQATPGSGVGPWCAYFTSWAAAQAGVPVGERGQGFGSVDALYSWAQRSGKALPAGAQPSPGDLIVWNEHIGVVEAVLPNGQVQTIEGNSSDRVSRRTHPAGSALGYVRLG
jgi:hypothetical protein